MTSVFLQSMKLFPFSYEIKHPRRDEKQTSRDGGNRGTEYERQHEEIN